MRTLTSPTPDDDGMDFRKIFNAVAGWPTTALTNPAPLTTTELAETKRLSRLAGATEKQIANRRRQWTTKRGAQ